MKDLVRAVDSRERAVGELWRKGHLSPGTIVIYLQWVRRFRTYCVPAPGAFPAFCICLGFKLLAGLGWIW
jgi:hypothetical protein